MCFSMHFVVVCFATFQDMPLSTLHCFSVADNVTTSKVLHQCCVLATFSPLFLFVFVCFLF